MTVTLRPYQNDCVDAFYHYYMSGKGGHGLIVVPTAGGKSLIIGSLATDICKRWADQRILILSHVQELIVQNYSKIMLCWPNAPAGIYSAALNKRQAHHPIVVASVQSVYKKATLLGRRDLLFIDEAHLLQPGSMGMYNSLIAALLAINPRMKICGFTATDYRTDSGLLTEGDGSLFDDVIIEIPLQYLLDEGYVTPPISKASLAQADMEGVKKTAGEFNIKQMAERFDEIAFMNAALDSDLQFFDGRHSIALFCLTVGNAGHVADGMIARGIACEVIDGEMRAEEREDKLTRFRSGKLRALASVGVITTGTDIPNIDCLVLLRATESPGLYQQIVGRGFRVMYADEQDITTREGRIAAIHNGKKPNFLILDHGGNIERHGAITHVAKPTSREKSGRKKTEKAKCRICDICRSAWPLEVTVCGTCQNVMFVARDPTSNLEVEASHADIMGTPFARGEAAQWFEVDDVRYHRHQKEGSPNSLRVTYYSGIQTFLEWIHFERVSNMRQMAIRWWGTRTILPVPGSVSDALKSVDTLKRPLRVLVKKDGNYYKVMQYQFNEEKHKELAHG